MEKETYIVVKGCTKEDLKAMLDDWLEMYAERLRSHLTFGIAETAPGGWVLKVDDSVDDTLFFYMVNYFTFPLHFKQTFEAEGYTIGSKHKRFLGKPIYVYVDRQVKEYDNVRVTTAEGETCKVCFDGKMERLTAAGIYKTWSAAEQPLALEQITVDVKALGEEKARREEEKGRRNTARRFKAILILLVVLIPLAYSLNRRYHFEEDSLLEGMSSFAIVMWFLMDYKIFYSRGRTLICVLLALSNIVFWEMQPDSFVRMGETLPLSAIVVMVAVTKFIGEKRLEAIDFGRWERLFFLACLAVSGLITGFVFHPLLEYLR